ncbi:dihydrolipoyl dehydrogenase [Lujinxingia litoralis]|uniref:Dihydrolipoyl dehydrogenase n=1 Tax=Lujinxingia litoralis TaxID=2211119 RepID=A0A328C5N0_9DELT|nr:dihydrolipoyl dehydrogenase [Lujinxingia litoralis]RAL20320.1 dihydrolipoyl dehydrogenase [Lujinxingia litoralis]
MEERSVDVVVIGAGTAGLGAQSAARKAGASVVMVEDGPYGTTCARVGCMPSKLLIAAADAARAVDQAPIFGVHPEGKRVDGRQVLERVRAERDRFVGFVLQQTERIPEEVRVRGRARLLSPTRVRVALEGSDEELELNARAVVIATGSSPYIPPNLKPLEAKLSTSADVFEWEDLPESVAVVGPGVIGLELGQALHRLGVRVAFFSPFEALAHVHDPKVSEVVHQVFDEEMELHLKVDAFDVSEAPGEEGGFIVRWHDAQGTPGEARFEKVLVTAGRRPNLEGLGLEQAGVPFNDRGRPDFDPRTTQVGDLPIFLAGDAANHYPLLHEASDEGRIAGGNAANFPDVRAEIRRVPLSITFTDPQIAVVGKSWRELDHEQCGVGEVSYTNQGRARVMAKNKGHVRIYADRDTGRICGAEMFGPSVEHTAHLLAWTIQCGMTVFEALNMPFYHPVVEEGIRSALRSLTGDLRMTAGNAEKLRYGPGT